MGLNKPVEHPAGQKICKLSENVLALIHGILLFTKLKTKLSIQIVTLQKSAKTAMYKGFQRTNFNFYYPLVGQFKNCTYCCW